MKEDRYLYHKILTSAIVMTLFLAIVWIAGNMFGYYWNGLQGLLSGTIAGSIRNGFSGFGGNTVVFLLMILSVFLFAAFASQMHRGEKPKFPIQVFLCVPLAIFLINGIIETQKLIAAGSDLFDVDKAIDHIVYLPFAACAFVLSLYMIMVILIPASIFTRIFCYITLLFVMIQYAAYAVFLAYSLTMSVLAETFSTVTLAAYLVCFASDVVGFFFLLSVMMTWCAIKREERMKEDELPLTRKQRRALKASIQEFDEPAVVVSDAIETKSVIEELVIEKPVMKASVTEEPVKEESVKEEPVIKEPDIETPANEVAAEEEPADEKPTDEEPIEEEPDEEESTEEEPIEEEPDVEEQTNDSTDEEPVDEEPTDDVLVDEEESTKEEPTDEETVGEEPDEEESTEEEPADDEPIDEEPAEEVPAEEEPAGEESVEGEPVEEEPSDDEPVDGESAEEKSDKEESTEEEPTGEASTDEKPDEGSSE